MQELATIYHAVFVWRMFSCEQIEYFLEAFQLTLVYLDECVSMGGGQIESFIVDRQINVYQIILALHLTDLNFNDIFTVKLVLFFCY